MKDPNPRVNERALKLAEQFSDSTEISAVVPTLADSSDLRVRFQLALSLGEFPASVRQPILQKLLVQDGRDRWMRTAVLTSMQDDTTSGLTTAAVSADLLGDSTGQSVVTELAELVARQKGVAVLPDLVRVIHALESYPGLKLELVRRVSRVLPSVREDAQFAALTAAMIESGRRNAGDATVSAANRQAAVESLGLSTFATERDLLLGLLSPATPPELQLTVVETLATFSDSEIAKELITRLAAMSPKVMERTREILLSRLDWTTQMLDAVKSGELPPNAIPYAELQRLSDHPEAGVRDRAMTLAKASGTSSRDEVVRNYMSALSLVGNEARGAEVFRKTCSVCHQVNGIGHQVGPNLATVTNRGAEAILVNLLDPNREVNPRGKSMWPSPRKERLITASSFQKPGPASLFVAQKPEKIVCCGPTSKNSAKPSLPDARRTGEAT